MLIGGLLVIDTGAGGVSSCLLFCPGSAAQRLYTSPFLLANSQWEFSSLMNNDDGKGEEVGSTDTCTLLETKYILRRKGVI